MVLALLFAVAVVCGEVSGDAFATFGLKVVNGIDRTSDTVSVSWEVIDRTLLASVLDDTEIVLTCALLELIVILRVGTTNKNALFDLLAVQSSLRTF